MGQTTNQIENYIDAKRDDLGSNLQELEAKVKSVTDWRQHFHNNPMTMVGLAVGGGVLLATMLGGGRKRPRYLSHSSDPRPVATASSPGVEVQRNKALETWDNIKGALIGVAATKFKNMVEEVVPGFHEQLKITESQKAGTALPPAARP